MTKQAERMLPDPRAKAKLREFLLTWLQVDQPHDLTKDPKKFPGFDAATIADLRTSLELFLDDIVLPRRPTSGNCCSPRRCSSTAGSPRLCARWPRRMRSCR